MEKQIKMAAKLYECRDSAKSLAKLKNVDYHEMLNQYKQIIQAVMAKEGKGEIEALLEISKLEVYQTDGVVQLLFMAAVVELIEPSKVGA